VLGIARALDQWNSNYMLIAYGLLPTIFLPWYQTTLGGLDSESAVILSKIDSTVSSWSITVLFRG